MVKCPECGEVARLETKSRDGTILSLKCTKCSHTFERRLSPRQRTVETIKRMTESSLVARKRRERLQKRREQEEKE